MKILLLSLALPSELNEFSRTVVLSWADLQMRRDLASFGDLWSVFMFSSIFKADIVDVVGYLAQVASK